MSWAAVVGGSIALVGGAYSANQQKSAANAAANSAQGAADSSNALQAYIYDRNRQDQLPWLQAGQGALNQLQQLNAGNYESFYNSPDYAYARDQMQQGVERGAAARGGLFNGGESVDLAKALNGVASQNYGNYYNRLASIAGVGQTAANNLAGQGQNYASATSQNNYNAANATASAYQQNANSNSALAGLLSSYGSNIANNWGGTSTGTTNYGSFAPTTSVYNNGNYLAPSNGSTWNFG